MKVLAALIVAAFLSSTTAVVTQRAQPAPAPVGLSAVEPHEFALRAQVEVSRSRVTRLPLSRHRATRRATMVDAQRPADRLVVTSPNAIQRYALALVGPAQFSCLQPMWARESHWNSNARNASGAYGIAQLMPGTWRDLGLQPTSDPRRQVDAGLAYVRERYGSPCGAWAFWQQHGWY